MAPSTDEPSTDEPMGRRGAVAGAVTGAVLLGSSAAVHAELYVTGYRHIPTIGSLFLLQAVAGTILAFAGVLGAARRGGPGRSWVGSLWAASALFAAGTVGGYAVSRGTTLFGFHEVATTAGLLAGLAEAGAFTVYGSLFLRAARTRRGSGGRVAPVALGVVAAVLVAVVLVDGVGIDSTVGDQPPKTAPRATTREPSPPPVVHVVISDYSYHPARVVTRPGEVIAVTNHDPVTHTLTAIPGSTPYGGFNTGYVDPGRTVRIRAPERPGTYAFYCSIHNFMKGVLVVTK
ncbi:MAG: cupredoxin domain-containing protein [Actinomycetota bacterium]|jgi:plastocyanin|nr:cupredoxin domain-containing protein [Actinomycetota bacterium]